MRNWRNWLLPVLTALAVACLAVLPLRLSALRDGNLTGTVHAEELGEDSNFPARPPELPGRVWLLAQLGDWPEKLTIVGQDLKDEELDRAVLRVQEALRPLWEAGILPGDAAEYFDGVSASRLYLRDQRDLSSASFVSLAAHRKFTGEYLQLYLDGETDRVLGINLVSPWLYQTPMDGTAMGETFLKQLGLEYENVEEDGYSADFCLTGGRVVYQVYLSKTVLQIQPNMNWAALGETDTVFDAEAYGVEASRIR